MFFSSKLREKIYSFASIKIFKFHLLYFSNYQTLSFSANQQKTPNISFTLKRKKQHNWKSERLAAEKNVFKTSIRERKVFTVVVLMYIYCSVLHLLEWPKWYHLFVNGVKSMVQTKLIQVLVHYAIQTSNLSQFATRIYSIFIGNVNENF